MNVPPRFDLLNLPARALVDMIAVVLVFDKTVVQSEVRQIFTGTVHQWSTSVRDREMYTQRLFGRRRSAIRRNFHSEESLKHRLTK